MDAPGECSNRVLGTPTCLGYVANSSDGSIWIQAMGIERSAWAMGEQLANFHFRHFVYVGSIPHRTGRNGASCANASPGSASPVPLHEGTLRDQVGLLSSRRSDSVSSDFSKKLLEEYSISLDAEDPNDSDDRSFGKMREALRQRGRFPEAARAIEGLRAQGNLRAMAVTMGRYGIRALLARTRDLRVPRKAAPFYTRRRAVPG